MANGSEYDFSMVAGEFVEVYQKKPGKYFLNLFSDDVY